MIELRDVSFGYDGERALDDVSVTIDDGEFVVIAGPNGCGKTTLLKHCNGLLEPEAGTVLVNGTPVPENPLGARTNVGIVFQHPRDQFVAATVWDDVAFGPENLGLDHEEIDSRVANALEAVGLADRDDERIETLSGGEQSRLAIAGALAMEPSHVLLDEPFIGVDEPSRQAILAHLESLADAGTGLVVATHDLRDLLEPADRVIGMVDGTIEIDATPAAARERLGDIGVRVPRPC